MTSISSLFFRTRPFMAKVTADTGLLSLLQSAGLLINGKNSIRVVNYHGTPEKYAEFLDKHFSYFADNFTCIDEEGLQRFFDKKALKAAKPGLILTFDDGLRSNYSFAAPLLERYCLRGWFFIPCAFIGQDENSSKWANEHRVTYEQEAPDRISMSWDELADLIKRGHVIGSHTVNHQRMFDDVPEKIINEEIHDSKRILEEKLNRPIRSFCWVGGELNTYNPLAMAEVRKAGYSFSFMAFSSPIQADTHPLMIYRTHVDSSWNLDMLRYQLSGVMDFAYKHRRKYLHADLSMQAMA